MPYRATQPDSGAAVAAMQQRLREQEAGRSGGGRVPELVS